VEIANRLIDTITEHLFMLGQFPQMGRRRSHDLRPGLRSSPAGEYVIIYRVERADALILHIIRSNRDIEALLSE
jgi:plasmid stabilization system protein ParE